MTAPTPSPADLSMTRCLELLREISKLPDLPKEFQEFFAIIFTAIMCLRDAEDSAGKVLEALFVVADLAAKEHRLMEHVVGILKEGSVN